MHHLRSLSVTHQQTMGSSKTPVSYLGTVGKECASSMDSLLLRILKRLSKLRYLVSQYMIKLSEYAMKLMAIARFGR